MKKEEEIAKQYLQASGFEDIVYEPDGNVPPDFLVDQNIAVEVRRLNQYFTNDFGSDPLEKLEFSLIPQIRKLLKEYTPNTSEITAYISVEYGRPLKVTKNLIKAIRRALDTHLLNMHKIVSYKISENLKIKIGPMTKKLEASFVLGFQMDNDGGGHVVLNIHDSLKIIVKEKIEKTKPYKTKYKIWWLALIDNIGYDLDDNDLMQLKEVMDIEHDFEKIVLISPTDPAHGKELILE